MAIRFPPLRSNNIQPKDTFQRISFHSLRANPLHYSVVHFFAGQLVSMFNRVVLRSLECNPFKNTNTTEEKVLSHFHRSSNQSVHSVLLRKTMLCPRAFSNMESLRQDGHGQADGRIRNRWVPHALSI